MGRDFLDELEQVLGEIATNPARYGFAEDDIREGLLQRFPYAVYYRILADRVEAIAVHHGSRDPDRWRSRI